MIDEGCKFYANITAHLKRMLTNERSVEFLLGESKAEADDCHKL